MRAKVIARGSPEAAAVWGGLCTAVWELRAHSGVSILHSSLQTLTLTHRVTPGGVYTQKSRTPPVGRMCTDAGDIATESPWVCAA